MSRAALAYAQRIATEPVQDRWPGRGDSTAYGMLLDEGDFRGGPSLLMVESEIELAEVEAQDYLDEQTEMPVGYYAALEAQNPWPQRWVTPRLLLGLVVAAILALALMLVTPVLARGRFNFSGQPGSISRYSELAASAPASVIAGEIDATSAPVEAAPHQLLPTAPSTDGPYSLIGPPSISVNEIEAVLRKYGSPAAGEGQVLYDLGVRYNIDPIYALAFFVHESGCGTRGVARYTHSLGNIRATAGYDSYEGYRTYGSWQEGMEDWYKLITDLYVNGWGLKTVDAIVPVYAPAGDGNSPPAYINSVKTMVDSWRGK